MFSSFLERTNAAQTILPVVTVGNSTVTGVTVDRQNYLSCALEYSAGVNPSVPTGFTVAIIIEHSTTTNSNFATWVTIPTFGTAADLSAASTVVYQNVDLRGANRYIRAKETLTFTGGTSPSSAHGVNFILGDAITEAPVLAGTNLGVLPTQ